MCIKPRLQQSIHTKPYMPLIRPVTSTRYPQANITRHGMSFRRNTSNHDVPIGNGEVVPKGAFAVRIYFAPQVAILHWY